MLRRVGEADEASILHGLQEIKSAEKGNSLPQGRAHQLTTVFTSLAFCLLGGWILPFS